MNNATYALVAALGVGVGFGCSLINELDDVKPSAASSASGGAGGASSSVGAGGVGGAGGAGTGGSTSSVGGGGSGGEGGMPDVGLIVVSGTPADALTDYRLLVLDAESGAELANEQVLVGSGVHDPNTDTWYLFETSSQTVDPTTTATLHSRKFNRTTNKWSTAGVALELQGKAPLDHRHIAVLDNRIVFAHLDVSNAPSFPSQLTTIDTSDPMNMMVLSTIDIEEANMTLLGVIGNPVQNGGTVNLIRNEAMGGNCRTNVRLVNVVGTTTTLQPSTFTSPGTYACTVMGMQPPVPGWARNLGVDNEALLVVPIEPPTIVPYQMSSLAAKASVDIGADVVGRRFLDVDVAPCQQVVVFVEHLTDQKLYAVPLDGGPKTSIALNHSGQWAVFEPYNDRILDFYNIGAGFALKAFALEGTSNMPTLSVVNQNWTPPNNFRARFTVARDAPIPCPNAG